MKTSELIKLLVASGCYIVRNGKRHDIWHSPKTGMDFTVPRHAAKELPTGTANNILRGAGLK